MGQSYRDHNRLCNCSKFFLDPPALTHKIWWSFSSHRSLVGQRRKNGKLINQIVLLFKFNFSLTLCWIRAFRSLEQKWTYFEQIQNKWIQNFSLLYPEYLVEVAWPSAHSGSIVLNCEINFGALRTASWIVCLSFEREEEN